MSVTEHGTINGYTNKKCRCEACKEAWSVYQRPVRKNGKTVSIKNKLMPESDHGTVTGYAKWRCRCDECKAAWADATPTWGVTRQDESQHGTPSRYSNQKCRCVECKQAWNAYLRPNRTESGQTISLRGRAMPLDKHGTDYGYRRWNCRCAPCTEAHKFYQRLYREQNVES